MKKYSDLLHSQNKVTLYNSEWTIIHWYYEGDVPVCVIMNKDNPLKPVFETLIGKENEQMIVGVVKSIYDK